MKFKVKGLRHSLKDGNRESWWIEDKSQEKELLAFGLPYQDQS